MEEFLLKGLSFMQKNELHFPASGKTSTFAHWWMELFTECSKKNKLAQTDCRACNTRQLHNGCICHRWISNSYHWIRYFNWTVIFCNCIRKLDHTNTKLHVEWLHVDFHAVCRKDFFLFVLLSACDSRWVLVYLSSSLLLVFIKIVHQVHALGWFPAEYHMYTPVIYLGKMITGINYHINTYFGQTLSKLNKNTR